MMNLSFSPGNFYPLILHFSLMYRIGLIPLLHESPSAVRKLQCCLCANKEQVLLRCKITSVQIGCWLQEVPALPGALPHQLLGRRG